MVEFSIHKIMNCLVKENNDMSTLNFEVRLEYVVESVETSSLGWFKTPVSSQTEKLMADTKFSDYVGPKHYKKSKKILKHFNHLRLTNWPQSFDTYHTISPNYRKFRLPNKKHVLVM